MSPRTAAARSFPSLVIVLPAILCAAGLGCSGQAVETAAPVPPPTTPAATEAVVEEGSPGADDAGEAGSPGIEIDREARTRSEGPETEIVILPGGKEPGPSLMEAAAAERTRRATADPSVAEVTDKNLHQYRDGVVTTAAPRPEAARPGAPSAEAAAAGASEGGPAGADPEAYWRARMRALRLGWHELGLEIERLEREAGELRRRFYAEDDPYVRDGRIKPAWDRTLDRLSEARREADLRRAEIAAATEEGRRAGALPGWLREGSELEPVPPRPATDGAEPEEPTIADEPPPR